MHMNRTLAALVGVLAMGAKPEPAQEPPLKISGPYSYENLSVFLLHGEEQIKGKHFVPLATAMAQKKVIVHETGDVNELMIENVSDEEVFIQAGEIVKGGRQDRTISNDMILPKRSGKIPVSSFCVKSGRWSQRSGEAAHQFSASSKYLSTKGLKVAARKSKDQGEVWREVAATQEKLTENVKSDVRSSASGSSLQLTLENGKVAQKTADYVKALRPIIDGKDDVIGFAFAIGGKMNSAELYGNHALFAALWPKILEASAVEAIAEKGKSASKTATVEDVERFLKSTDRAKENEQAVTRRVKLKTKESGDNVVFETNDAENGNRWVHKSFY
jgi:hypothetical protein